MNKPTIYWIDLFCGAGGTTTGIHMANANAKVIACVNHDPEAIKCHLRNHPDCLHLAEDVRDFKVVLKIKELVSNLRKISPDCIINIWASLECTHFSKAKGGLSRDADSRTLADHLYKYIEQIDPDYVYIENVREFMTWGPLDKKGKPIQNLKGIDYNRWKSAIKFYGYDYKSKLLNSADFGAYTSRERYFGIFSRIGMPIAFPEQTHAKRSKIHGTNFKQWKAVKEVLHLHDEGRSIFGLTKLGKPYSENTLKRVYAGLLKFSKEGMFVKRYNGGDPYHKSNSINDPLGTILTSRTHALVKPVFLTSYYGNGNAHSIDDPCNTLTTKDRYAAQFINYDYSAPTHTSIENPAGSITVNPKHNLISAQWTVDTQYSNTGRSIEQPGQTLIARMDKKPVYLISANHGTDQRKFQTDDSETIIKIREFMRDNGIKDIKIRMLNIIELKAIQGFPDDFELTGTKTNQLKFIGNSVVPLVAQKLVESNYEAIVNYCLKSA
ncbi:DNA cytosine methyltransferase [Aquimarina algiphila]|uniref:DNA (cytosine-5-)-methyltransferase n=1 Tax=Aquimarina algiphila TaxID=2047982 RepID=A0A554VAQ1_9FLAO|nr:DNA cytosine methyltransferase [Aquimarina algiphila]TSE03344.1 DNA cytosine methyltransferase [Aquimarina algiphila]